MILRIHIFVWLGALLGASLAQGQGAAPAFAVASIRPSSAPVQFEHDGRTEITPGTLTMRDVTVATCIKWAYGVQDSQISGPEWLQSEHFDIVAKADEAVGSERLKPMMQTLLADRFRLAFHRQSRELSAFALTVSKGGHKLKESVGKGKPYRQNSDMGTVAQATTMRELADFLSGPLKTPVVDMTGLTARYDFSIDFTPYLQADMEAGRKPDTVGILVTALQGDLGLKLESRKESVEVLMIERVEKPSEN